MFALRTMKTICSHAPLVRLHVGHLAEEKAESIFSVRQMPADMKLHGIMHVCICTHCMSCAYNSLSCL